MKNPLICVMTVDIGDGRSAVVNIHLNDNVEDLARAFVTENNLDSADSFAEVLGNIQFNAEQARARYYEKKKAKQALREAQKDPIATMKEAISIMEAKATPTLDVDINGSSKTSVPTSSPLQNSPHLSRLNRSADKLLGIPGTPEEVESHYNHIIEQTKDELKSKRMSTHSNNGNPLIRGRSRQSITSTGGSSVPSRSSSNLYRSKSMGIGGGRTTSNIDGDDQGKRASVTGQRSSSRPSVSSHPRLSAVSVPSSNRIGTSKESANPQLFNRLYEDAAERRRNLESLERKEALKRRSMAVPEAAPLNPSDKKSSRLYSLGLEQLQEREKRMAELREISKSSSNWMCALCTAENVASATECQAPHKNGQKWGYIQGSFSANPAPVRICGAPRPQAPFAPMRVAHPPRGMEPQAPAVLVRMESQVEMHLQALKERERLKRAQEEKMVSQMPFKPAIGEESAELAQRARERRAKSIKDIAGSSMANGGVPSHGGRKSIIRGYSVGGVPRFLEPSKPPLDSTSVIQSLPLHDQLYLESELRNVAHRPSSEGHSSQDLQNIAVLSTEEMAAVVERLSKHKEIPVKPGEQRIEKENEKVHGSSEGNHLELYALAQQQQLAKVAAVEAAEAHAKGLSSKSHTSASSSRILRTMRARSAAGLFVLLCDVWTSDPLETSAFRNEFVSLMSLLDGSDLISSSFHKSQNVNQDNQSSPMKSRVEQELHAASERMRQQLQSRRETAGASMHSFFTFPEPLNLSASSASLHELSAASMHQQHEVLAVLEALTRLAALRLAPLAAKLTSEPSVAGLLQQQPPTSAIIDELLSRCGRLSLGSSTALHTIPFLSFRPFKTIWGPTSVSQGSGAELQIAAPVASFIDSLVATTQTRLMASTNRNSHPCSFAAFADTFGRVLEETMGGSHVHLRLRKVSENPQNINMKSVKSKEFVDAPVISARQKLAENPSAQQNLRANAEKALMEQLQQFDKKRRKEVEALRMQLKAQSLQQPSSATEHGAASSLDYASYSLPDHQGGANRNHALFRPKSNGRKQDGPVNEYAELSRLMAQQRLLEAEEAQRQLEARARAVMKSAEIEANARLNAMLSEQQESLEQRHLKQLSRAQQLQLQKSPYRQKSSPKTTSILPKESENYHQSYQGNGNALMSPGAFLGQNLADYGYGDSSNIEMKQPNRAGIDSSNNVYANPATVNSSSLSSSNGSSNHLSATIILNKMKDVTLDSLNERIGRLLSEDLSDGY